MSVTRGGPAPTAATAVVGDSLPARRPIPRGRRVLYTSLGMVCVVVGVIGVFVPVWPTTVFAIAASILFARANPRLYTWLLRNRLLGPYLENWHLKTGITMAFKIRTCTILWVGLGVSAVFVTAPWLYALLAAVGIGVTWHVFAIRTKKADSPGARGGEAPA